MTQTRIKTSVPKSSRLQCVPKPARSQCVPSFTWLPASSLTMCTSTVVERAAARAASASAAASSACNRYTVQDFLGGRCCRRGSLQHAEGSRAAQAMHALPHVSCRLLAHWLATPTANAAQHSSTHRCGGLGLAAAKEALLLFGCDGGDVGHRNHGVQRSHAAPHHIVARACSCNWVKQRAGEA